LQGFVFEQRNIFQEKRRELAAFRGLASQQVSGAISRGQLHCFPSWPRQSKAAKFIVFAQPP
jgi:hypothetical protein